jgi:hypothetical protein
MSLISLTLKRESKEVKLFLQLKKGDIEEIQLMIPTISIYQFLSDLDAQLTFI